MSKPFTIKVFFRGDWCPWCNGYLRDFNRELETIKKLAMGNLEFFEACTPGYYNNEGSPGSGKGIADQQYGEGPVAFYQLVADWQKDGSMEGLSLK